MSSKETNLASVKAIGVDNRNPKFVHIKSQSIQQ